MKPNPDNPYGYKICYQEKGGKELTLVFKGYSFRRAKKIKENFIKLIPVYTYPDKKPIKKITWMIIQIIRKEVKDGIWRQCPFRQ